MQENFIDFRNVRSPNERGMHKVNTFYSNCNLCENNFTKSVPVSRSRCPSNCCSS